MQQPQHGLEGRPEIDAAKAEAERAIDADLVANSSIEIDPEDLQPKPWVLPDRRRVLTVAGIIAVLLALVLLPPLISVNRFRHRITQSVSESLGRPVHIDNLTLNMLPLPGFTLENFVVEDDPAFSAEPIMRANSVRVTLRAWSLWRRRVEFSRISLEDPSLNLVHRADGRWNFESILLQAAKMEAAPTAQAGVGDEPRFPYVEATGARINVKMGLEKLPISLTEADLALWLTQPDQWKLRLDGHPVRTSTAATDTGTLRVQGTLGKASTLSEVPIDLTTEWRTAPLGGVSWVLVGRDAGFRGVMTLRTIVQGTVGNSKLDSDLVLSDVRRADFVPQHTIDATIHCTAQATNSFHQINSLRCGWPSSTLTDPTAPGLSLAAEIPDVLHLQGTKAEANLTAVPANGLLDVLRLTSTRVSPNLSVAGAISGKLTCCATTGWSAFSGNLAIDKASLAIAKGTPFLGTNVAADLSNGILQVQPVELNLGAPEPALLDGHIDANGLALHLTGPVLRSRLLDLAASIPPFGDGIEAVLPAAQTGDGAEAPIHVDLTANRTWTTGEMWSAATAKPAKSRHPAR
jgi:AsmA protein